MPEKSRSDDATERARGATGPHTTADQPAELAARPLEIPRREEPYTEENDRLNGAARTIGHAAGTAIHSVENLRRRFTVIPGRGRARAEEAGAHAAKTVHELRENTERTLEETGERVARLAQELGERAGDTADELGGRAADTIRRLGDRAAATAQRVQESAGTALEGIRRRTVAVLEQGRWRASRLADERPEQILLAAAAAGFILGFLLRVGKGVRHD